MICLHCTGKGFFRLLQLSAPRIILCLRDPVDRLYSFFKFQQSILKLERSLTIDRGFVEDKLARVLESEDLSRFIL